MKDMILYKIFIHLVIIHLSSKYHVVILLSKIMNLNNPLSFQERTRDLELVGTGCLTELRMICLILNTIIWFSAWFIYDSEHRTNYSDSRKEGKPFLHLVDKIQTHYSTRFCHSSGCFWFELRLGIPKSGSQIRHNSACFISGWSSRWL